MHGDGEQVPVHGDIGDKGPITKCRSQDRRTARCGELAAPDLLPEQSGPMPDAIFQFRLPGPQRAGVLSNRDGVSEQAGHPAQFGEIGGKLGVSRRPQRSAAQRRGPGDLRPLEEDGRPARTEGEPQSFLREVAAECRSADPQVGGPERGGVLPHDPKTSAERSPGGWQIAAQCVGPRPGVIGRRPPLRRWVAVPDDERGRVVEVTDGLVSTPSRRLDLPADHQGTGC